jgi:hypothetical protein
MSRVQHRRKKVQVATAAKMPAVDHNQLSSWNVGRLGRSLHKGRPGWRSGAMMGMRQDEA